MGLSLMIGLKPINLDPKSIVLIPVSAELSQYCNAILTRFFVMLWRCSVCVCVCVCVCISCFLFIYFGDVNQCLDYLYFSFLVL